MSPLPTQISIALSRFDGDVDTDHWAEWARSHARDIFNRDGQLAPMLLFLAPDQDNPNLTAQASFSIAPWMTSEKDKCALSEVIKNIFERTQAYAYVIVMEAWLLRNIRPEDLQAIEESGKSPADIPDHGEALLVVFETKRKQEMSTYEVVRENGTARVGQLLNYESDGNGVGRMTGLLFRTDPQALN